MRKKEGRRRRGREEEGGWTDGGVGPQRRVIHHTTMQSALVQPLFLFLCRSFSLLLLLHPHTTSLSPFIHPSSRLSSLNRHHTSRYLPFIHSFADNSEKQSVLLFLPAIFLFFFCCSLSPSLLLLWQSFLGFIISSGDIPPSFSPFSPPSLPPSLFLFRSHSFFFLPIFTFCAEKKSLVLFFSLLRLSLMDQRKKVWIEGWRGIMCGDKRRMRRIRKGGIV